MRFHQMELFVAEATRIPLPEDSLLRIAALRTQMQRLKSQIQRDGFVLEQLSLKTKTPYVQFTLTKRLTVGAQDAGGAPDAAAAPPADSVEEATITGGVTSALAAANKDPMSRPPM
jgi:hypothetical protein